MFLFFACIYVFIFHVLITKVKEEVNEPPYTS